jgi:SpoVK/Ycf46/Vps4 family AAA+-type ATPase
VSGKRIIPKYTWSDLILPKKTLQHLHEVADQAKHSTQVYKEWDFENRMGGGPGITALFYGPPGTGKTLSAGVIAADLGLDLFRINLSSVVSKYIGETEKNLKRIFSQAETTDVVLFFDEADALFGKRSEATDARDRYANMETTYLLQLMEEFEGLAILAANHKPNLDKAFMRRLRFVVEFPFPDASQRRHIWENIFPSETEVGELDYDALARFKLTGGEIRDIALNAAFLAAAKGMPVNMSLIKHALSREKEKMTLS